MKRWAASRLSSATASGRGFSRGMQPRIVSPNRPGVPDLRRQQAGVGDAKRTQKLNWPA